MTATVPYLEFQAALAQHQQPLAQLPEEVREAVHAQAIRQWQLEERILKTPEALRCPIDSASLTQAMKTIQARYADRQAFLLDLAANGLDEVLLQEALERELRVDAVLALVANSAPRVTEQDAEIFYWQHRERFEIQAARQMRHILITVNEDVADNKRDQALSRIKKVAGELASGSITFADLALRYSECPTALNGGELGWVTQGKLYPELDSVVFTMQAGQVSSVVESEMGFHLLYCEAVREAGMHAFSEVSEKLLASLQSRRDKQVQTGWLKQLPSLH